MRLKIDYKLTEEKIHHVELAKENIIEDLARKHLIGLLSQSEQLGFMSTKKEIRLSADFFVLTYDQAIKILEELQGSVYYAPVSAILKEDIEALNNLIDEIIWINHS